MHLPWARLLQLLQCGTVLFDARFQFPDGSTKPKWIVLLSGLLEDQSYAYCLTTTQLQTYEGNYSTHLVCTDPTLGGKKVVIEVERLSLISATILRSRYDEGIVQYKGSLNPALVAKLLELIEESDRIPEYLKDLVVGNDQSFEE